MIRRLSARRYGRFPLPVALSITLAAAGAVAGTRLSAQPSVASEDLRSEQARKRPDLAAWILVSLSAACSPPACQVLIDGSVLRPFGPPPNNRKVAIDAGNHLVMVTVNNEKVDSKTLRIAGGEQGIAEMKVPAAAAPPRVEPSAPPPTSGSIVIVTDSRVRVKINEKVDDVVGESTFQMPFGEHYVSFVDGGSESKQRAVRLTRDRPTVVVYFHAMPAPAPVVKPLGGDITWASVKSGTIELGCVKGDANCRVDEKPHTANVKAFDMMTTEVTVGQFEAWLSKRPPGASAYERPDWSASIPVAELHMHPAVRVTWEEANAFCADMKARLPTEEQWEAVLRQEYAGRVYAWDANVDALINDQSRPSGGGPSQSGPENPPAMLPGNFADQSAGRKFTEWTVLKTYDDRYPYTAPVASFHPVAGVYDLIGNVWEWMENNFDGRPGRKVLRGGSFTSRPPITLRISHRLAGDPAKREDDVGFRCVK